MRRPYLLVLLLLSCSTSSWPGDFGFFTKNTARINVSRPPDALLPGSTLAIRAREGARFPEAQALELAIEKSLSGDYKPEKVAPALVLNYVATLEPVVISRSRVTETRIVRTGTTHTEKALIGGGTVEVADTAPQNVPVDYWEARGSLGLLVTVFDSKNTLLDTFEAKAVVARKVETTVMGVSQDGGAMMPSSAALQGTMYDGVALQLKNRYTKTIQPVEVPLAMDDVLRPGNVQAMNGQWKQALEAWTAAQLKRNQPDRTYNMAVAYEALAYQTFASGGSPDDAEPLFQQSLKLYDEALRLDPRESRFSQAQKRCADMRANFSRAKEQYAKQDRDAAVELAKAEAQKEAKDSKLAAVRRADTKDEAEFRMIVRKRIQAMSGEPNQEELIKQGRDVYALSEDSSRWVVLQELNKVQKGHVNLDAYRSTFSDLVADKIIDATDRQALTRLSQRLGMTQADVRSVESQFQFSETAAKPAPSRVVVVTEPKPGVKPATMAPATSSAPNSAKPPGAPVTSSITK